MQRIKENILLLGKVWNALGQASLNDFTWLCTISTTHQIQYFSIK